MRLFFNGSRRVSVLFVFQRRFSDKKREKLFLIASAADQKTELRGDCIFDAGVLQ